VSLHFPAIAGAREHIQNITILSRNHYNQNQFLPLYNQTQSHNSNHNFSPRNCEARQQPDSYSPNSFFLILSKTFLKKLLKINREC